MFDLTLERLYEDLKARCPSPVTVLEAAVADCAPSPHSKAFRQMLMAASIALNSRGPEMSVMHYFLGYVLMQGGCTQRTVERLAKLGLCVHPSTVQRKLLTWQGDLDAEILSLRDSWASGGTVKYQLIGDNWDKDILPTYRTSDRSTISLHLFNMYAVVDRITPQPFSDFSMLLEPSQLSVESFIPSKDEQAA